MTPAEPRRSINIRDLAQLAGVHQSTVSRALNPQTAKRVSPATTARIRKLAAKHGYRPNFSASSLRNGRTGVIGVLVQDITDAHTALIVRGVQDGLASQELTASIAETREDTQTSARAYAAMTDRSSDALIVISPKASDHARIVDAASAMPVVLCQRGLERGSFSAVTVDDFKAGQLAALHLHELGHRRVAQLPYDHDIVTSRVREAGFLDFATQVGLDVVPFSHEAKISSFDEGRRMLMRLKRVAGDLPTAVFVHSDAMAVGVISALQADGLHCPDDVSIIGFDDSPIAGYTSPALTTIRTPALDLGQRAAEFALDMLAAQPPWEIFEQEYAPRLVVRASTAPPR